ncbi:DNA-directed RNA polymerase sigma-70 factor [Sphingomonas sp. DBB INV C78]|uniref:sigma-70 family RNA polymerase sigma factor n=1 Tax=Sphingomonas sp. DBB INV C78 TaxID=3349434 RepID=UPI0036D28650
MDDCENNSPRSGLTDGEFKADLTSVIPDLRAFARSMSGDRALADDLVQDTLLKAWAARRSYESRRQFKSWIFTILRNSFLSQMRRKRFVGEWNDLAAEIALARPASQERVIELQDVYRALQQLPATQREAIVLIGAGGLSYEEAAEVINVCLGTVKSRLTRARKALEEILASGRFSSPRSFKENCGDPILLLAAEVEEGRARSGARANMPSPDPEALAI